MDGASYTKIRSFLWHLVVHDLSPFYVFWHLCTTVGAGGGAVVPEPQLDT